MKKKSVLPGYFAFISLLIIFWSNVNVARQGKDDPDLDQRVEKYLEDHRWQWHDMNVPESDG